MKDGVVVLEQSGVLPDGTEVRVEPVLPHSEPVMVDTAAFWRSVSFDELAAAQGVAVPQSFEDVLGGWPEDEIDDGFEDAVVAWRQTDGEHRG